MTPHTSAGVPPSAMDLAAFAQQLGIEPDVFRLQWSRTISMGDSGYVTVSLDLDVRQLSDQDRKFIVGITQTLAELESLHQRCTETAAAT